MEQLVNYGIQNEESDFRIHVGVSTQSIYFFSTQVAAEVIMDRDQDGEYIYPTAFARNRGRLSANGFLVPPEDIDGCMRIGIPDDIFRKADFGDEPKKLTTSQRGRKAEFVVSEMLKRGLVPIPLQVQTITDKDIQIKGKDIISVASLEMQVKCDWRAGPKSLGGSGHLYLQVAERNHDGEH